MTRGLVPLRRMAALSVALTLLAVSIASAQTPASIPTNHTPAGTVLLNTAAFVRLVQQPRTVVAPAPVVAEPIGRIDLLRSATVAATRQAKTAPAQKPAAQQRSWLARHKMAFIIPAIVGGAVLGGFGIYYLVATARD